MIKAFKSCFYVYSRPQLNGHRLHTDTFVAIISPASILGYFDYFENQAYGSF